MADRSSGRGKVARAGRPWLDRLYFGVVERNKPILIDGTTRIGLESDSVIARIGFAVSYGDTVQARDVLSARFLWLPVDDQQAANWLDITDAQTPGWTNIADAQTPNWQDI